MLKQIKFDVMMILACGALLGIVSAAMADRTDVWSASSLVVYQTNLKSLSDGGCAVQAFGNFTKADGGVANESSALVEVTGAARTTCLDILQVKAPSLFKTDKGL